MERKISERFEHNGKTLEVVEDRYCIDCLFYENELCMDEDNDLGSCGTVRSDGKSVIAKEVKE